MTVKKKRRKTIRNTQNRALFPTADFRDWTRPTPRSDLFPATYCYRIFHNQSFQSFFCIVSLYLNRECAVSSVGTLLPPFLKILMGYNGSKVCPHRGKSRAIEGGLRPIGWSPARLLQLCGPFTRFSAGFFAKQRARCSSRQPSPTMGSLTFRTFSQRERSL